MNHVQDPFRQIGYLQQCLSSDKKPLGFLLGAGCPMAVKPDGSPLIAGIAGMTDAVLTKLRQDKECAPLIKIVDGHFFQDGHENVNVEDILSHVRALRVVAGKDGVRDLKAADLDKLDSRVCKIIQELSNKALPNIATPYHHLALWADSTRRERPIEVFTTNYDLLMEQAFEDCRVPYFDGFAGARKPFFDIRAMEEDELPSRWARLWKLHGSINWYQDSTKGVLRGASDESDLKRVIHPSHLKYEESRRMPYLAMIDRFRTFLKQPSSALVVCGYSFRDDHINEVIVQGLQATQTAIAFALLHGEIDTYTKAIRLASERSNLTLLARDGGIVSGRQTKWNDKDPDSEASNDREWLTWVPVDPNNEKSRHCARFHLGDFSNFGKFLHELVGKIRQSSEASHAE
jgi:hypothetical protein